MCAFRLAGSATRIEGCGLQVENKIFEINRQTLLNDSEFFKELFSMPPEQEKPADGSSVEHPLVVEGVGKEDMTLFLRALYPPCVSSPLRVYVVDSVLV